MNTISEDKRVLRNVAAKIKRIIRNDLPKLNNENAQFFLMQAFVTVDSFLSSASADLKKPAKAEGSEALHDEG